MIVVDIETSGLDFSKCGIWQIGAIELENPENRFLEEGRLDDEDEIIDEGKKTVFGLTGKIEKELRDKNKQSQKQLLKNFLVWVEKIKIKNPICQNTQFDIGFIETKARKYGLEIPYPHRAFDLHTLAQIKFFQINKEFLIKENKSDLGLTNILDFVGMKDERGSHNALEDCKLEAECFSRLMFGRNLLPEFSKFKIPEYLLKCLNQ